MTTKLYITCFPSTRFCTNNHVNSHSWLSANCVPLNTLNAKYHLITAVFPHLQTYG